MANKSKYRMLENNRRDYSKISGTLPLPNLVAVQTESFEWLLNEGLKEALNEVFPIIKHGGNMQLDFLQLRFEEPKFNYLECKERNYTYNAPMKATLRLTNNETGVINEQEIFLGDFPLMTDKGTFIYNGIEKVIVSQIRRSPGAYLSEYMDKSGKYVYKADLIPMRGTWLEFESDLKDLLMVRIDRQRKIHATVLLKALGLEDEYLLIDLFGQREQLLQTLDKDKDTKTKSDALLHIFAKMKPGEPRTEEGIANFLYQKFFDPKRYNLGVAGRFKYGKKLGVYNRMPNHFLAEDLVDAFGVVKYAKGTFLTQDMVEQLRKEEFFEKGAHKFELPINEKLFEFTTNTKFEESRIEENKNYRYVNIVKLYTNEKKEAILNVVGTDLTLTDVDTVTIPDIIATFSYFINLMDGYEQKDDIDHLGNRRIHSVGELIQNRFRVGLSKMAKSVKDKMTTSDALTATPANLVNIKPLTTQLKEFFNSDPLSQFMDQTNPLSELSNKRRISALGSGGIKRDRASFDVRDVHYSHYGRICPIETPEGQNIGLITNLATYAKINNYGFIETPYRKIDKVNGRILEETEYLSAEQERNFIIAQSTDYVDEKGYFTEPYIVARRDGDNIMAEIHEIDYIDVSPKQVVSIASACIPFLENDDTTRALMGANMQRQALPLIRPSAPLIGTGIEHTIARDSGLAIVSKHQGSVNYVDSKKIVILDEEGRDQTYFLQKFNRSNQGTCINQQPIVKLGDKIQVGDILADGPAMRNGDLALGQNVTIAFMTWHGYNYEDAVIMSERLVKDDVYTSIHIEEYKIECRVSKLGKEEITRDIPNVREEAKSLLDERGIIVPGAEVKEGDILVGKTSPRGEKEWGAEEKLMRAIFNDKAKEGKDTSLKVPNGGSGTVLAVKTFSRKKGDELLPGVEEVVHVYIVQKRKISEGDKMSGRHGNKGVISRILPVEDMPFLPDGTPVDIMLNPLGVPSRMNIGQILEVHLGLAAQKLGIKIATSVFDGISNDEIAKLMEEAKISQDGKSILYDGQTGEPFDERISVGVMYMIKLSHMVDDKLHARATGPYSLVTQQPLGGKAQNGGQRFGEMEVWALEAYGAAHTLQEILTIKSDDRVGRRRTYANILKGKDIPKPGLPESFKVLQKELQALAIDMTIYDQNEEVINMEEVSKQSLIEERRIASSIREVIETAQESRVDMEETSMVEDLPGQE